MGEGKKSMDVKFYIADLRYIILQESLEAINPTRSLPINLIVNYGSIEMVDFSCI